MWNCFENVLLLSPVVLWVSMTFLKLVIYDLTDKVESTKGNNFKLCKPTTNANIISLSLCLSLSLCKLLMKICKHYVNWLEKKVQTSTVHIFSVSMFHVLSVLDEN